MSEDRSPPPKLTGSNSSRESASDSSSWTPVNREERLRASSWDDSEDETTTEKPAKTGPKSRRIYSADTKKFSGSVASEISELKKQFFENLKKENEESIIGSLDTKSSYDRRHSPARIRRRTKSSSSSSPVKDITSQISSEEKELDQISLRSAEYDSKYYLGNFLSDLKPKRISLEDGTSAKQEGAQVFDTECIEMYNQLNSSEGKDADGFLCKTSRKLSQILEVEENRRDLEKKSEENLELFRKNFKRAQPFSPLETARSEKDEKLHQSLRHAPKEEKFKPMNFEEFSNFHSIPRPSRGSLSERAGRLFQPKIHDEFISLSAKTGRTQLASPMSDDPEMPFQFFCFTNPIGVKSFPKELLLKEKGASNESLRTDFTKNSTPRKSTDRSDRIRSGKAKSTLPESPKFILSIDSERSLKVEDLDSSGSVKKTEDGRLYSTGSRNGRSNRSDEVASPDSLKNYNPRINRITLDVMCKVNTDTSRSEISCDRKAEKRLESPDSSCGSAKQGMNSSRSKRPAGEQSRWDSPRSPSVNQGSHHSSREKEKGSSGGVRGDQRSPKSGSTWSDLIDAFQETSNHSFNLENHFPGFPRQKENSWDSDGKAVVQGDNREASPEKKNSSNDLTMSEAEENLKSRNIELKDYLLEQIKKEEMAGSLQAPQNLFYFNVDENRPFGIGEFGDVTFCAAGNSDTVDFGKPKEHGDGIVTQRAQGVVTLPSEKREKEVKTQRQLWTELRRDVRAGTYKPFPDGQDFPPRFVPIHIKTSKSDNCINTRKHEDVHENFGKPKNVGNSPELEKPKEAKPKSRAASEASGSSFEELENPEFDCERTPRLSKSLSDFDTGPPMEDRLPEKAAVDYDEAKESESFNVNVIFECKEENTEKKSKKSRSSKNTESKKAKRTKLKKTSSKEPFHEYLAIRKGRHPVPPLKLRNSNCFQNFYKRFISVFCLTSNSSAATSK